MLSASWENGAAGTGKYEESSSLSVLESLQKASNLQHIKKWIHVPVWLAAEEPTKETCGEIEATGATLLEGRYFRHMATRASEHRWEYGASAPKRRSLF